MSNLFIDLYQYRQRENKNNLEDWLTECLAAVLRTFDKGQWAHFLHVVNGVDVEQVRRLLSTDLPEVLTQVEAGANFGRPDLVIYLSGSPLILFENKVQHGVAQEETEEGKIRHQLHRYAEWLFNESGSDSELVLMVFLTHLTRAPVDFATISELEKCPYRGISRRTETWGRLARKLLIISADDGERSHSFALANALNDMLEDRDMANEFPDSTAIASLQMFLSQGSTIENLLYRMWNEVSAITSSTNMSREELNAEFQFGRYSIWRYVNKVQRVNSSKSYVMTGIWFPDIQDTWPPEEIGGHRADGAQIFLEFGDDKPDAFAMIEAAPTDEWFRPSSTFLRLKPLHEFKGTPDAKASAILEWLAKEAQQLREFLIKEALAS